MDEITTTVCPKCGCVAQVNVNHPGDDYAMGECQECKIVWWVKLIDGVYVEYTSWKEL